MIALILAVVILASGSTTSLLEAAAGEAPPPLLQLTPTPVFSLRRIPGVMSRAVADHRLAAQLDQALADPALGGAQASSCLSVEDPSGRAVYSRRPTLALIPASTMKLSTAAVALARLGPAMRFVTEVRAQSPPQDATVADLWIVGGGDPLLSTTAFALDSGFGGQPRLATPIEVLADRVLAAGIRHVTGSVVGDDSRYDVQRTVPTWNPRYQTTFEVTPLSALVVDKGFVERAPAKPVVATSPAAHAAMVLRDLLVERGVVVDGPPVEGRAPPSTTVAQIESPPLGEVVAEILRNSDNMGAEMLLKEVGMRLGTSGSTVAGLEVARRELAAMGVPLEGVVAVDASGLDRSDRLTCAALQTLLRRNEGGDLDRALPVAGLNGTLYRRFVGTPAAGRVRAKTGGLDGVVAIAGWVSPRQGGSLEFSLITNDLPRSSAGTALQDKVVSVLATYPEAPPSDQLGLPT